MTLAERLQSGDLGPCLEELLERWRRRPSDALAALIDRVDAAQQLSPLDGATRAERQARWLELEREASDADLGPLIASAYHGNTPQCRERVACLLRRGPDPRIRALLDDSRLGACGLDELAQIHREKYAAVVDDDDETAALADALEARLAAARPTTAEALLARIREQPEDDALRHVYADLLTEQGDPRGEFIALQLRHRKGGTAASRKREKALRREHGYRWAGAIAPHVDADFEFDGGFLGSVKLKERDWSDLVGHEDWATVHSIELRQGEGHTELLLDPVMRSLRCVLRAGPRALAGIAAMDTPNLIHELHYHHAGADETIGQRCDGLPHLRILALTGLGMTRLIRSFASGPVMHRIEKLIVSFRRRPVIGTWLDALTSNGVDLPNFECYVLPWWIRLGSDGARWRLHATLDGRPKDHSSAICEPLIRAVGELPSGSLSRFEVSGPRWLGERGPRRALLKLAAHFTELEVVEIPPPA